MCVARVLVCAVLFLFFIVYIINFKLVNLLIRTIKIKHHN